VDEDLRTAIDRLIVDGGRLTIHGVADTLVSTVILEQPGSRFGILQVRGTAIVASEAPEAEVDLLSQGWTDPTVTNRLGREVRLHPATSTERPTTYTRTWRVPPTLASEIAVDVAATVGGGGHVEFQPIPTRVHPTAAAAGPTIRPPIDEQDLDEPDERRAWTPAIPTPARAILAIALTVAIAAAWTGMIRGAPRVPASSGSSASGVGGATIAGATTAPSTGSILPAPTPATPAPASAPSPTVPIRSHLVDASTEEPSGRASAAIDGDPVTAWHAAFGVPQWIEIGLDVPSTVTSVVLLIAQSEDGPTRHMIQVTVSGKAPQVVGIVDRRTTDGDRIVFRPVTPIANVERIRIETMSSPSNAGWYEVIVR